MGEPLTEGHVLAAIARVCRKRIQYDPVMLVHGDGWGLQLETQVTFALTVEILEEMGYGPVSIFSGARTCREQRLLRDQGLDAARQSWHTVGRAFDAHGDPDDVEAFRFVWGLLGGRAGFYFRDSSPNHYDLPHPNGGLPEPCW